ncbi:hypothetical protein RJT34_04236 [Clitoria ternatea]|uniref:Uncharacterized protein n=1 Tax=Clitoria ternatea TaxID=43366 RepID=A0AAN9KKX1_CLITE
MLWAATPRFGTMRVSLGLRGTGPTMGLELRLAMGLTSRYCPSVLESDIDTREVYGMTMPKAEPLIAIARPCLAKRLYD